MSSPSPAGARRPRLILGIETSCDETAAAVVESGRVVWSNVVASQAALHAPYGGVFPEIASRQHVRDIAWVIASALSSAGVTLSEIEAIAVTAGPGLGGALLVGVNAAKGLSLASGKPLVGVNHLAGHLASNWLHTDGVLHTPERTADGGAEAAAAAGGMEVGAGFDGARFDGAGRAVHLLPLPPLPHLALIVSGGHTELLWVRALDDVTSLAATRDDAAGEAFDKAARLLGLGYPGGPALQRAAVEGDASRFPLPVARTDDGDWSFSGLKTALSRRVARLAADGPDAAAPLPVADLAASFQAAVVRALVERLRPALAAHPARAIAVSGGVSANTALRAALGALAAEFGMPVLCPPLALCTDNAAMIAAAGWHAWSAGRVDGMALDVAPDAALGAGR